MRIAAPGSAFLLCWCAACGGDDSGGVTNPPSPPPPPPPPSAVAAVLVSGPGGIPVPGDEVQLVAKATDASGAELTDRAIAWSSSSETVAQVSETGLVNAAAPGSATITATSEGKSGSLTITVREGARIGPEGGTVVALGGAVRLVVPAGALAAPVSITVENGVLPRDPSVVQGSGVALGPAGTSFASPASLTLRYDPDRAPSGVPEADLRVHQVQGATLASREGVLDPAAHEAEAPVSTLGTFAVRRAPPAEPCTDPEYRQFDFWLGEWNVTSPNQPPGSAPTPSDITAEPGGCAVFESFANGAGRSINVYDPADDQWHQTFIFSNGQRQVLVGGLVGKEMILTGNFPGLPGSFDRWTWTPLGDGRVRQLQETSSDGGATVVTGFDGTYAPR